MEKLDGKTFDLISDNIKKLEELFPEIVTEGKVDVDKLALLFDKSRNEDIDGKKDGEERYEFTWKGKKEAIRMAQKQTTGTLRPCREESVNFDETQNLYIEGDNLEVLRALQSSYRGKIKMIYIDPPYNTGKDFVYKDNFNDNIKNYKEMMNESYKTNTDASGRLHTNWLNMMYPRLKLAKNLLSDDGVIFISIDDNEVNNLKKICDEVFGEENLISQLIWKSRQNKDNRNITGVSIDHEYILVYCKLATRRVFKGGERNTSSYKNPDNDVRGDWTSANMVGLLPQDQRPNCHYDLINPKTGINYGKPDMGWRYDRHTMSRLIDENRIIWPQNKEGRPRRKVFLNELSDNLPGYSSIIAEDIYTRNGTLEIDEILGKRYFNFPKSYKLIKELLEQTCDKEDIVLDFFSGSATTAHAVMQLNAEDGGNRKFIMVQLPEETEEKSEAYKNGYKNICEIGKERIRRVGKIILDENKDKEGIEDLDIGFKVFKLDTTNIKEWDDSVQDTEKIKQMALALDNPIKESRSQEDVIYEILLKYGVDLTMPIEEVQIMGAKVYSVGFGYLMICLDDNINLDLIEAIGEQKPNRVVLYDKALSNETKINGERILKNLGVKDIRTI